MSASPVGLPGIVEPMKATFPRPPNRTSRSAVVPWSGPSPRCAAPITTTARARGSPRTTPATRRGVRTRVARGTRGRMARQASRATKSAWGPSCWGAHVSSPHAARHRHREHEPHAGHRGRGLDRGRPPRGDPSRHHRGRDGAPARRAPGARRPEPRWRHGRLAGVRRAVPDDARGSRRGSPAPADPGRDRGHHPDRDPRGPTRRGGPGPDRQRARGAAAVRHAGRDRGLRAPPRPSTAWAPTAPTWAAPSPPG